jgi:hypothetical protein
MYSSALDHRATQQPLSPPLSISPPGSSASHYHGMHTPSRAMPNSLITPVSKLSSIGEISPQYSGWQHGHFSGAAYVETPLNTVSALPQLSPPDSRSGPEFALGDSAQVEKHSGRVPPARSSRPRLGKPSAGRRRIKRESSDESDDEPYDRPNTLGFAAECVAECLWSSATDVQRPVRVRDVEPTRRYPPSPHSE